MAQQNKKVKDEQNLKNNVEKRTFLLGQASQSSHFMNSVLKTRGIFSCAIDTFLEIWLRIHTMKETAFLKNSITCLKIKVLKKILKYIKI